MSTILRTYSCAQEESVKARKSHRCSWCGGPIAVGEQHVVATEFPGGEAGYADGAGHPVRLRVHHYRPCYHGPQVGGMSARRELILALGRANWDSLADSPFAGEFIYGKQADAVLAWIASRLSNPDTYRTAAGACARELIDNGDAVAAVLAEVRRALGIEEL